LKLKVLLVLLVVAAGTEAFAATYHVDANHSQADDNGSGSAEQPYRTIARGVRGLRAGDVLVVRRGIYREGLEVAASGTSDSPIRITGEAGVVIRGTRPLSGFQKADGPDGVYYVDVGSLRPVRMVETNQTRWRPLPVEDPNGVRFEFRRPVLYLRVDALSTVHRVPGSFWLDPAAQRLYFRTFDGGDPRSGNYGLEAGNESDGNFRIRASHVIVSSLTFEYARTVQLYQSASVRLESFDLLATPMQVLSSTNCSIDRLKIENYIMRGKTFEWHQAGSGTSVSISADSTGTSLRNAIVLRGWNAVAVGGTASVVDNVQVWGFPNHGLGVSGQNHTLSRLRIWNVQDTIYMQGGHNIEIRNSHVVEAIHIRNGSSQIKLRNNLLFGSGVFVLEDSKVGFDSDYNLFAAPTLDYRLGKARATSFGDVKRMHGLETHSIEFGNAAGVVEGWEGRSTQPNALSLTADSPAIDSGDPGSSVPAGGGKRADIGPFERGAANEAPGLRNRPTPPMPGDLRIIP
jgi:hypothetical protein